MKYHAVAAFVIGILFLLSPVAAYTIAPVHGPVAHLTEELRAHYYYNGTVDATEQYIQCADPSICRFGYVDVSIPNDESVLQDIRVNVSLADSNIENDDWNARAGVAASVPANSRSRILMNTAVEPNASYFNVTDTVGSPALWLALSYANSQGGIDLFDSDNIVATSNEVDVTFWINNPTSKSYDSIDVAIQFERDTGAGNEDSVNILSAAGGVIEDSDSDGHADRVKYIGTNALDLPASGNVSVTFTLNLTEGTNLINGDTIINFDEGADAYTSPNHGLYISFENTTDTLTERTITDQVTKSSIRQGVEFSLDDDPDPDKWRIRGFVENIDPFVGQENLTYNVSNWSMYDVTASGLINSLQQYGEFSYTISNVFLNNTHGRLYTSSSASTAPTHIVSSNTSPISYDSNIKPFYASEFDWHVVWEEYPASSGTSADYTGIINETLDLPILHVIDIGAGGAGSITYPIITAGSSISPGIQSDVELQYITQHTGHADLEVDTVDLWAVVPELTNLANDRGDFDMTLLDVQVWITDDDPAVGGTNFYLVNPTGVSVTPTPITAGNDGTIHVVVNNIAQNVDAAYGDNLTMGNYTFINFTVVSTDQVQSGDAYNFTGNVTFTTLSGTPITEDYEPEEVIAAAQTLTGYTDIYPDDATTPEIQNVSSVIEVVTTGSPITGIYFVTYVPNGSEIVNGLSGIQLYLDGALQVQNTDYTVTQSSTVLPDGTHVWTYLFEEGSGGSTWTLGDGQKIEALYQLNITVSGYYVLPTIISAFDPDTGTSLGTTIYGNVNMEIPKTLSSLAITDQSLSLAKRAIVFKPGLWVKKFEVFNPNDVVVPTTFETEVFADAVQVYVSYIDNAGRVIDEVIQTNNIGNAQVVRWDTAMNPYETRIYEIKVLTPPITEVDRDVEVLDQIDEDSVKIQLDVYLKNLGSHEYEVGILNIPIGFESILEVKDEFGNNLAFTGGRDSSTITIPDFEAYGLRTVTIIYRQVFPTVIATPDRDRYDPNSPVNLEILIINGPNPIQHPFLEVEVYTPTYQLVYADIIEIDSLDPMEQTELYDRFVIPAVADAGFYVTTIRFRDSSGSILSTYTGKFYVAGVGTGLSTINFAIIMIIGLALLFFAVRRLRDERRRTKKR